MKREYTGNRYLRAVSKKGVEGMEWLVKDICEELKSRTHFMPNVYDEYAILDIPICRECPMRSFYRRLARLHLQSFLKIVNFLYTTRSYACRKAATCDV